MDRLQPFTPATVSAPDVTRVSRTQSGGQDSGRQLLRFARCQLFLLQVVFNISLTRRRKLPFRDVNFHQLGMFVLGGQDLVKVYEVWFDG